MRHRVKGRKLSRTSSHRKSTMQSLAMALIKEHRIVTTVAKAKELRGFVEPLITRAKEDTHHNRRQVFGKLQNNEAVNLLFAEVGPKAKDRPGGYTRVIKAGFRKGDGAELAVVELVDYNDIKPEGTSTATKKRTRRAGKSNTPTSSEPAAAKKENSKAEAETQEETKDTTESAETVSDEAADSNTEDTVDEVSADEESSENSDSEEKEKKK